MPEITKRRTGEFLRKAMEIIWEKPDGENAREILAIIGQSFTLSEYESGFYPSSPGEQRFEKIIRFATIDLVKAGWLVKNKGKWFITELGKDAFKKYKDPEVFYGEAVKLYHEWKRNQTKDIHFDETQQEQVILSVSFEEAEETAWKQISGYLRKMNPYEFQQLVADLLVAMKYHIVWIAPPGKDKGVDIIAHNDPLGTTSPRIKVQVKHREDSTRVEALRAFMSTLGNDDVGIFVSSGGYSSDAKEEARTQERRRITLLDLEAFFDLWVEHYDNLTQDARQRLPLKPIYYLDLEE